MATILPGTFIFLCKNDNDGYIDKLFADKSPNGEMREWRLSLDVRTGERYATLSRAAGPEEEFDKCIQLPKRFVPILLAEDQLRKLGLIPGIKSK